MRRPHIGILVIASSLALGACTTRGSKGPIPTRTTPTPSTPIELPVERRALMPYPNKPSVAWTFRRVKRTWGTLLTLVLAAFLLGPGPAVAQSMLTPRPVDPFGNFESAVGSASVQNGILVKGWMIDPDTSDPIYAWVTVDGVGRHLFADVSRPDVGAAFGQGARHGFWANVGATPGPHTVCVTASNVGAGHHRPLGCRNVVVPTGAPTGNFERATGVEGGVEVQGWTIDPSSMGAGIFVWVTVDGVGRHLLADRERQDVSAAFPPNPPEYTHGAGPNHGFLGTLPAAPGAHRVCVTASNIGHGHHTMLGCRNVTVA